MKEPTPRQLYPPVANGGLMRQPLLRVPTVARGLPGPRPQGSWRPLLKLGASRELHLERRTLAQGRLDPNAPAVHLDDLLGDGEPEAGAALGLGKGAVDLMELLEDARPLVLGNAGPRIGHAHVEVTV